MFFLPHVAEAERSALLGSGMSFLDIARLIEMRLGGNEALGVEVAARVRSPCFSLTHALLANMGVAANVTTNYDDLFERAARAAGLDLAILPHSPVRSPRYLLKMHGCVTHPEDIILTRKDYVDYSTARMAQSSMVESLLLTSSVLLFGGSGGFFFFFFFFFWEWRLGCG